MRVGSVLADCLILRPEHFFTQPNAVGAFERLKSLRPHTAGGRQCTPQAPHDLLRTRRVEQGGTKAVGRGKQCCRHGEELIGWILWTYRLRRT
jgi:hypothetical protein